MAARRLRSRRNPAKRKDALSVAPLDAVLLRRDNRRMASRFSTLMWLATSAKATSIADALARLPATRLDVAGGFAHILWDPIDWTVEAVQARAQVLDALRESGATFELAIGTYVGSAPER